MDQVEDLKAINAAKQTVLDALRNLEEVTGREVTGIGLFRAPEIGYKKDPIRVILLSIR